jgi:hypothetical protein
MSTLSIEARLDNSAAAALVPAIEPALSREEWRSRAKIEGSDWQHILEAHLSVLEQIGAIESEPSSFELACLEADAAARKKPIDRKAARLRQLLDSDVSLEAVYRILNDAREADRQRGRRR